MTVLLTVLVISGVLLAGFLFDAWIVARHKRYVTDMREQMRRHRRADAWARLNR